MVTAFSTYGYSLHHPRFQVRQSVGVIASLTLPLTLTLTLPLPLPLTLPLTRCGSRWA